MIYVLFWAYHFFVAKQGLCRDALTQIFRGEGPSRNSKCELVSETPQSLKVLQYPLQAVVG